MSRGLVLNHGGVGEWNPYVLFGINYVGREAFYNPIRVPRLVGLLFPDDKTGFIVLTMLFLWLMGIFMYLFLRKIDIKHECALIGGCIYMLAPKWVSEAYHGPYFVFGLALLPLIMLHIYQMYKSKFKKFHQYILLSVLVALMYLCIGAAFLNLYSYLFIPFFFYLYFLYHKENKIKLMESLPKLFFYLMIVMVIFFLLIAYIFLPFLQNYFYAQRSFYGEPTGWSLSYYFGLIFPWVSRFYTHGIYDLEYENKFATNMYLYFGILAVPIFINVFSNRIWNKITVFFTILPIVFLVGWSSFFVKYLPLLPTFERMTKGESSEARVHTLMIFSLAVVTSFVFQQITENKIKPPQKYLKYLNLTLIGIYAAALLVFLAGTIITNSSLKNIFWGHVSNRVHIFVYYYFCATAGIFMAMFLVRIAILWVYHRQLYMKKRGLMILLFFMVIDFLLVFKIWYPFTNLKERYSDQIVQNKFISEQTQPLDRIGAFQYQIGDYLPEKKVFFEHKQDISNDALLEGIGKIYYKGQIRPIYDPALSYFPLLKNRSFYGYHESLMPDYFWDFDLAMNKGNPRYWRQSFIGLWDPYSKLLDVAGIKYVYWFERLYDPRLTQVGQYGNSSFIYRNEKALPRAYIVDKVEYFNDRGALLHRMAEDSFVSSDAVATEDPELNEMMQGKSQKVNNAKSVQIDKYSANDIIIKAKADSQSILVFNDMYYPNWTATVDQKSVKIFRVNCLFRGIVLPPGESLVEMKYYNQYFHIGLMLSLLGWCGVLFYFLVRFLRKQSGVTHG